MKRYYFKYHKSIHPHSRPYERMIEASGPLSAYFKFIALRPKEFVSMELTAIEQPGGKIISLANMPGIGKFS